MTYTIAKEFTFSASHQLVGLYPGHQCARLHGHNYRVRVQLAGDTLADEGWLLDYGDLAAFKAFLDERLDHRHINDAMPGNPTAERVAAFLHAVVTADVLQPLDANHLQCSVGVSETPKTWAWYTP